MKASVIVPVYNAEAYLGQCLESLFGQSFDDFEIVCVDDGSTDGSRAILQEAAAAHSGRLVVLEQQNGGPGAARMAGIDCAQGEYLFFLDSDDFAEPTMLEHAVDVLDSTGADVAIWDVWYYNERFSRRQNPPAGTLRPEAFSCERGVFSWRDNPDEIMSAFQNWPWNKAFRAAFVRDNAIAFGPFHRTEDLQFTVGALVCAEKIAYVDERLVNYRVGRADSAMGDKDSHPCDVVDAFALLKRWLEEKGVYDQLERGFVNWAASGVLYTLNTLNTREAYALVCECLLEKGGFGELGIAGDAVELVEGGIGEDLSILLERGPEGYAFYRSRVLNAFVDDLSAKDDFAQTEIANLHGSCDARGKEIDRLYVEWDKSNKRLASVEQRLQETEQRLQQATEEKDALEERYQDLERRYHEMENAAEQKIGRAVCAIPRAVQRKILESK